ncbi:hypothetical protein NLG97_g3810 [Lecanicillium saksenae]|uniref:Uncharacterized protein n=1 Tax=Lecanicillium saksenae TaxID=468837 RepID=A0ACC1QXL3_9HYPO|nr:hypothetical protein NLG97_g3810 [Lecanicillium saksenae]
MGMKTLNTDCDAQGQADATLEGEKVVGNEEYVENDTQEAKAGLVSYYICREVNGFDKQHHMLASVNLNTGDVANRIVFHYWAPNRAPVIMPTTLTMEQLQLIHGMQDLGSIWLPRATSAFPGDLNHHICNMTGSFLSNKDIPLAVDWEDKLIEKIRKATVDSATTGDDKVPFSLHRFPVWGKYEDHLALAGSCFKLWNWHKPESQYRKEGSWNDDLQAVLADAEMTAGGNLRLLLRGCYLAATSASKGNQEHALESDKIN